MKIVGIGHRARQGKTTLALAMQEKFPHDVKVYAFADELKRYCAEHHEELVKQYPQISLENKKDDPIYGYVSMLQYVGTNVMRAQDPDIWVKKLDARLKEENPEVAVITDVRFPNEAQYVHDNGGLLVKIIRVNEKGEQYLDPMRAADHPSEVALDDFQEWDMFLAAQDGKLDAIKQAGEMIINAVMDADDFGQPLLVTA